MSRIEAATDEGNRDFMRLGSCVSTGNPDQWFPRTGGRDAAKMAARICRHCWVKAECLTYALNADEQHGIWGGLTPQQRNHLHLRATTREAS